MNKSKNNDSDNIAAIESKCLEFIELVERYIAPYQLSEKQKASLRVLARKYDYKILIDSVDIGISNYIDYDKDDNPTDDTVEYFLDKLGGIAFNKSKSPLDTEITHIINICKNSFSYWDTYKGKQILSDLSIAMQDADYTEDEIAKFFREEVKLMTRNASSWTTWRNAINRWIDSCYSDSE